MTGRSRTFSVDGVHVRSWAGSVCLLLAALGRSSIDMDTVEVPFHTKRYLASIAHDGREGDAGSTPLVLNPSVKTPCAGDKGLRTEYGATSLALMK